MKSTSKNNSIAFVIFIVIAITLFLINPTQRNVPKGLPTDYYDMVDDVNDFNTRVIVFSDSIDLNNDLKYINVKEIENIVPTFDENTYVVIDMFKYKEYYSDKSALDTFFNQTSYKIFITNYKSSNSTYNFSFMSNDDKSSDLIVIANNDNRQNPYQKTSYTSEFESLVFLNYSIIHTISMDYEQNN